jgi:hypothetical protein
MYLSTYLLLLRKGKVLKEDKPPLYDFPPAYESLFPTSNKDKPQAQLVMVNEASNATEGGLLASSVSPDGNANHLMSDFSSKCYAGNGSSSSGSGCGSSGTNEKNDINA